MSTDLDRIDQHLVQLLLQDGRRSYADMASLVGLSVPAVKRRIDRLREVGIITGFTAQVDFVKLGWTVEAFIELRYSGRTKQNEILAMANKLPEVQAAFTIAGDPDALFRIRARDIPHLQAVIDAIRHAGIVTGTKTLIVLDSSTRQSWYMSA